MAEGLNDLDDIEDFLKKHYRIEMPRQQISAYKAQQKARERKTGDEDPPKRRGTAQPIPPKSAAPGVLPPDLFDDLKKLREIRDKYGDADWGKRIDAIG